MELRHYVEVSPLHLEPETWRKLVEVMETGPSRAGGKPYDVENPWHALIGDPMRYGCWVYTDVDVGLFAESSETMPQSLLTILADALASGASYVLFDADLLPMGDWPTFEHDDAGEPATA